jgi:hypothetical protein
MQRTGTGSLVRTLLGIAGSFLVFLSPIINQMHSARSDIAAIGMTIGVGLAVPSLLGGIFGAIVSYWKRRFGGTFMLLAGLWGFISVFVGGGWGFLGCILLIGCAISAFWHRLD